MVFLMGGCIDEHFEKYLNTLLQNTPLWHMYYFDVKAIENQHMQEKL